MNGLAPKLEPLFQQYRDWVLAQESLLTDLTGTQMAVRRTRLERVLLDQIEQDRKRPPLSQLEIRQLVTALVNEMAGYGPLDPLLHDEEITEIMVNGPDQVWVEKGGRLQHLERVKFNSERHLRHIAQIIVAPLGRRLDDSNPMVDGRLPDGARVNVIIPPLTLNGTHMTIRRFRPKPWRLPDLIATGALTPEMADLLEACVVARLNLLVAGSTSSGKTSLLGALGGLISPAERVITVEDVAELRFEHPHVVQMEARPANVEGNGAVPIWVLVKNALRMRPDRIIVGEVRGGEVVDMLEAANTGHRGTWTTIHANSALDSLARVVALVKRSGVDLSEQVIRETMLPVFDVIVFAARLGDGARKVTGIYWLTRQDGQLLPRPIYEFRRTGFGPDGTVEGHFVGPLCTPDWLEDAMSQLARVRQVRGGRNPACGFSA